MRLAFYMPKWRRAEDRLAQALKAGNGGRLDIVKEIGTGHDLVAVVGIKSAPVIREMERRGQPFLYFDKSYNRDWPEWWRVAASAQQPTGYLGKLGFPPDRSARQGWDIKPWRKSGNHILIAGASAKSQQFYGLPEPTAYVESIIARLKELTGRPIIYRPKPSWQDAKAIEGAAFIGQARHSIFDDLKGAHALITYSSNACLEAMLAGVPSIVLGNAVAESISSRSLDEIEAPFLAGDEVRKQLLANLAHCQWSLGEIRSGGMWPSLKRIISIAAAQ